MQYALNDKKERIEATPKMKALCPCCEKPVASKCGDVKIWHWAHVSLEDCDPWYEPETLWHREWKNQFPKECREVIVGNHRADVKHKGVVFEFQHSSISFGEVREREVFYKNMIWIIDKTDKEHNFTFRDKVDKNGQQYSTFKWKWCPVTWKYSKAVKYIDFGDDVMFKIWSIHENGWGSGVFIVKGEFKKLWNI